MSGSRGARRAPSQPPRDGRYQIDYVLPLRWTDDADLEELTGYLCWLAQRANVIVVDGSPPEVFDRHDAEWHGLLRHVPPDADLSFANGKVNGVVTGMRLPGSEHVIVADDDVRYDDRSLAAVAGLLSCYDLVRPQNYFEPVPWHARWDTARSLINRAVGADYPGTFGVRRSTFTRMGGYDGDVLFENLELVRTVAANGGREARASHIYVRRSPPTAGKFWSQRVRQAYDEFAKPMRAAAFLAIAPAAIGAAVARNRRAVLAGAAVSLGLAEIGRVRAGGKDVFPVTATLLAPVWVAERSVCIWIALALRISRLGVRYSGRRLVVAAHSTRQLRPEGERAAAMRP